MRAIDIIWWSIEFSLTLFWSYVLCAANEYDVRLTSFVYFWLNIRQKFSQIIQNNTIKRNKIKVIEKNREYFSTCIITRVASIFFGISKNHGKNSEKSLVIKKEM